MEYTLGNTNGIDPGSSPGIPAILDALKAGQAKLVTAYPYSYVKDGYWATGYTDQPSGKKVLNPEYGDFFEAAPEKILYMNGKLYPYGNDWSIRPVTKTVQTGSYYDEGGQLQYTFQEVPTGNYRIRSRADGNVFDEAIFQADDTGKVTAYSPKIYQTGSNSGGFFGGGAFGGFLNDLVQMAQETAPVWMPAVTSGLLSGAEGALGAAAESGGADLLNEATAGLQDVYGGALPIDQVAAGFETVAPEVVSVGSAIPTPEVTPTELAPMEPSVQQPDYFSADAGPLADTTATLDNAFVQDMSQGIEQAAPPEADFLKGMEKATAEEGAGVAGAESPTGTYDGGANYLSGMEETTATEGAGVAGAENPTGAISTVHSSLPDLTPNQIASILKGIGMLGGVTAAGKAIGGLTGTPSGAATGTQTITAPTPISGTLSAINPYNADYFQQVQQNYNRLFPTTPTDVATPLQNWYQTKFTPDTNISNKLFGV